MIDDDPRWMEGVPIVDPFDVEISFCLWNDFPTDTRGRNANEWPTQPLTLPAFPRTEKLSATSREVEGYVEDLATYYREAALEMRRYGADNSTLYWLRLRLGGSADATKIGFAWWDTMRDMQPFFRWIEQAEDGDTFDDLDQGWRVQAAGRGGDFYFRHTNWEEGEEFGKARAPISVCRSAARAAWNRTTLIVEELEETLGIRRWR